MIGDIPIPDRIQETLVPDDDPNDEYKLNENYWIESSVRPHICDGVLYTVASNRLTSKKSAKVGSN